MSNFNLAETKKFNEALKAKLAELSAEFGIDVTSDKVKYGENIEVKIVARRKAEKIKDQNGVVVDINPEHRKFADNAKYSIYEAHLGKKITIGTDNFTVVGLSSTRSNSKVVVIDNANGKLYGLSRDTVCRKLGM